MDFENLIILFYQMWVHQVMPFATPLFFRILIFISSLWGDPELEFSLSFKSQCKCVYLHRERELQVVQKIRIGFHCFVFLRGTLALQINLEISKLFGKLLNRVC